jgi:hypothetical protein
MFQKMASQSELLRSPKGSVICVRNPVAYPCPIALSQLSNLSGARGGISWLKPTLSRQYLVSVPLTAILWPLAGVIAWCHCGKTIPSQQFEWYA